MKTGKSISLSEELWNELNVAAVDSNMSLSHYLEKKLAEKADDEELTFDIINNKLIVLNNKLILYARIVQQKLQNKLKKTNEEREKVEEVRNNIIKNNKERLNELKVKFGKFLKIIDKSDPNEWIKTVEEILKEDVNSKIDGSMILEYLRLKEQEE